MTRLTPSYAYWLLVAIIVISAAVLTGLWLADPEPDTLAFEAAKGCIGIFTVALVGLVVSNATSAYQRQGEDWRRENEQKRDERQRKDEILRSLLDEALANYHEVKRARRQLKAKIWMQARGDRVDSAAYDDNLTAIDDAQLNFEMLESAAKLISDERVDFSGLAGRFSKIEKYLNKLVREYESNRRRAAHGEAGVNIAELPKLQAFLKSEDFRPGASNPLREATNQLRSALLLPLELPPANTRHEASDGSAGVARG